MAEFKQNTKCQFDCPYKKSTKNTETTWLCVSTGYFCFQRCRILWGSRKVEQKTTFIGNYLDIWMLAAFFPGNWSLKGSRKNKTPTHKCCIILQTPWLDHCCNSAVFLCSWITAEWRALGNLNALLFQQPHPFWLRLSAHFTTEQHKNPFKAVLKIQFLQLW